MEGGSGNVYPRTRSVPKRTIGSASCCILAAKCARLAAIKVLSQTTFRASDGEVNCESVRGQRGWILYEEVIEKTSQHVRRIVSIFDDAFIAVGWKDEQGNLPIVP